jgi:hypothetical protein
MKLRITIGIIAAMFALVFSACETQYIDISKPEAKLLSLRIAVDSGDLLIEGETIPAPVETRDWDDEDYNLFNAEFETIAFKLGTDIEDAWFYPTVSKGAKVKWGVANRTVRPNDFSDTRVPATFDEGDFIYFEVTSEDGEITNYYRFGAYVSSPVKELAKIAIAGREAALAAPDKTWNGNLITPGTLHITQNGATPATIDATKKDERASLRYAITPYAANVNNRQPPAFGTNNALNFNDGEFLYVEVQAENSLDVFIYLFRVYVGRIATIQTLTFKTPDKDFEALGKGTGKTGWTDNSGAGSFNSPHQPADTGFSFAVELDEVNGTWYYAKSTAASIPGAEPTWLTPQGGNSGSPSLKFANGEYLFIKVVPPHSTATVATAYTNFYKVKVGLLSAEFIEQPKPNYYNDGVTADALKFKLDRTLTDATYQWYEANSWYGGYGFDSMGRIGHKGTTIVANPLFGTNDRGILRGATNTVDHYTTDALLTAAWNAADQTKDIKFDVSAWHVSELDEKTNVSLHNGGNQFYRLPTPGKPVPGASGTFSGDGSSVSFVPQTNYKPFLSNFSNESHYYWVVVTDSTGLKATSERAVIVTEQGSIWNYGKDLNQPVEKKHYIIDLHAYETPGAFGLQDSPRNTRPFIDGSHRDEYTIKVTFPEDFDIMDYSVFTAQALFFLADGREWIQNWTQGDIGFWAIDPDTIDPAVPGSGTDKQVVLWYNLTNDNATRGLQSSGNDPSGSGLSVRPTRIVIKPAGTKPINQMPPFQDGLEGRPGPTYDSVGRMQPQNTNDAQGWFTPYIELSELRFEGPTRKTPAP